MRDAEYLERTLEDEGISLGSFEKLLGDNYLRKRAVAYLFAIDMKDITPLTDIEPAYYERVYKQVFKVGYDRRTVYFKKAAQTKRKGKDINTSKEEYIGIKLYKFLGGNTYEHFIADFDTGVFVLSEVLGYSPHKVSLNYIQSKKLGKEMTIGACIGLEDRYYENIKVCDSEVAQIDMADYEPFNSNALKNSYRSLMRTVKGDHIELDEGGFIDGMAEGASVAKENFERNRLDIMFYLKIWEKLAGGMETHVVENVGQVISGKLLKIHEALKDDFK